MDQENNSELPCKDKLTFDSKKEAENTALAVDWQRGVALKAYKCQDCKLWHLSSK